jgi:hypothetical protein
MLADEDQRYNRAGLLDISRLHSAPVKMPRHLPFRDDRGMIGMRSEDVHNNPSMIGRVREEVDNLVCGHQDRIVRLPAKYRQPVSCCGRRLDSSLTLMVRCTEYMISR